MVTDFFHSSFRDGGEGFPFEVKVQKRANFNNVISEKFSSACFRKEQKF